MKKMTALLLAAAMAVSMTACSPSEKFVESQEAPAADEQAESGSSDGSSSDGLSADTQAFLDSITAEKLVKQAFTLEDPHCPHGRPVYTVISREKLFELVKRT